MSEAAHNTPPILYERVAFPASRPVTYLGDYSPQTQPFMTSNDTKQFLLSLFLLSPARLLAWRTLQYLSLLIPFIAIHCFASL